MAYDMVERCARCYSSRDLAMMFKDCYGNIRYRLCKECVKDIEREGHRSAARAAKYMLAGKTTTS